MNKVSIVVTCYLFDFTYKLYSLSDTNPQGAEGLCQLCRHNFEHNRYLKASSIMPA